VDRRLIFGGRDSGKEADDDESSYFFARVFASNKKGKGNTARACSPFGGERGEK